MRPYLVPPSDDRFIGTPMLTILRGLLVLLMAVAAAADEGPGGGGGGGEPYYPPYPPPVPPTYEVRPTYRNPNFDMWGQRGNHLFTFDTTNVTTLEFYFNTQELPDGIRIVDDQGQQLFSTGGRIATGSATLVAGEERSVRIFTQGTTSIVINVDAPFPGTWWHISGYFTYADLPPEEVQEGCPRPDVSQGQSVVHNSRLSYIHDAVDIDTVGSGAAGCGSCGGGGSAVGGLTRALRIERIHRYLDQFRPGSFGPGVFSNLDVQLTLWDNGAAGELWDPHADRPMRLTPSAPGHYADVAERRIRALRLLQADGSAATSIATATQAVADLHDGGSWIFELVQTDAVGPTDRQGRLIAIRDRDQSAVSITYAFPADATDDHLGGPGKRLRLMERAQCSDALGRTIRFGYAWAYGQPVIERLTTPAGDVTRYQYAGTLAGLSGIIYPDGTTSTFRLREDATTANLIAVDYVDAGATTTHRAKTVFYTALGAMETNIPLPANRVRKVVRPDGTTSYENFWQRQGDQVVIYAYEGGTRMVRFDTVNGLVSARWIATDYAPGIPPELLTWAPDIEQTLDSQHRLFEQRDALGRFTTYERDPATGAVLSQTRYNANVGVVERTETTYNDRKQPLRQVDANGLVSRSVYDDQGNLRFVTEGIRVEADGITEDVSQAQTREWRYRPDGQVLQAIDPAGRVTDFIYDARGFQTAEISPPDDPDHPEIRATKQWFYDDAGRLDWSEDAAGHRTTYHYDTRNRVHEVRYGNGSKDVYEYGTGADANLLVRRTDRDGMVTAFAFDSAGRETSRTEGAQDPTVAITTTTTYVDGTDLPLSVTQAGQRTTTTYDGERRPTAVTRTVDGAHALTETTLFDADGRTTVTTDAFNRRTYLVYDDLDRVIRIVREALSAGVPIPLAATTPTPGDLLALVRPAGTNPAFVIEDTAYDAGGRVLATTDGRGFVTQMAYDTLGRMTDRWEAFGTSVEARWHWTYDAAGNRETETDPLLRVTRFVYNGRNLLKSQTVAYGTTDAATTRFTYTLTGQRATQTDANDHVVQWIYGNCCDWLEDVIDEAGYYTHYTYTPGGLIETVRDANLHLTRTDYDGLKRPSIVTNGDMEATTTIYDDNLLDTNGLSGLFATEFSRIANRIGHRAVAVRNHMQEMTVQVSDGLGRTVMVIDPERHVTRMVYDQVVIASDGATLVETSTIDPMNNTVRQRVDGLGRVREVVDAQLNVTTISSDPNGNRRHVSDPLGHGPSFDYDARNRQTGSSDGAGNSMSTEYDLVGNVLRQSDGFTRKTETTYTERNQKRTEKDRLGNTTAFTYDPAGNLLTISDAENEAKKATVTSEVYEAGKTRYAYTERNQLETERFPGETTARSYTYHPNGQLWTRTDQRGRVTTYSYDGANRLTNRAYSDAPADAFELDDAGRITKATSGRYGTVIGRAWKPTGLIETETTTWPADISGITSSTLVQYGYDAANRATTVTYPGGATLAREFTARNQLDRLTLAGTQLAQAGYDDAGRRISLLYGNGLTDTRIYTDDNRLKSTVVGAAVPKLPVVSLGYQYDANRRKTTETDGVVATRGQRFGYDNADRLTSWNRGVAPATTGPGTQSWTLTPVGDWKQSIRDGAAENRDHTAVHEIETINNVLVLHDAAGNLARTAQGQGFSWDAENRLLMADALPSDDYKLGQVFYWYDALGRRVAKRVHGSVTRYVHDGWQVIQELDTPYVANPAEAASDGALTNLATVPDGALLYPTYDAEGNRHDPTRVNFQPETEAIPDGFIADKGRAFDVRTNGLSYGWDTAHTDAQVRHFHPLPQYDTMGHFDDGSWRIALPNGTYPVAIVAGDATSLAHSNNLVVNGQPLSADPDPGDDNTVPTYQKGDFDGWLVNVEVTDGFLTIQAGTEAFDPTLTHVEIGAMGQPITSEMQQRLADQILAATQRTGGSPFWNGGRPETRNYVWDPSYVDALVAYQRTTESGTETFYVHAGAQYSVQAVTDSNGNVVERYSYSAYGDRTVEGVTNGGRSVIGLTTAFTGRALDEETGLIYFRNRMYSPRDGRFVSRDPLGYVDGTSLYRAYFAVVGTDPYGLAYDPAGLTDRELISLWATLDTALNNIFHQIGATRFNYGQSFAFLARYINKGGDQTKSYSWIADEELVKKNNVSAVRTAFSNPSNKKFSQSLTGFTDDLRTSLGSVSMNYEVVSLNWDIGRDPCSTRVRLKGNIHDYYDFDPNRPSKQGSTGFLNITIPHLSSLGRASLWNWYGGDTVYDTWLFQLQGKGKAKSFYTDINWEVDGVVSGDATTAEAE